jgi:hypothetical protein
MREGKSPWAMLQEQAAHDARIGTAGKLKCRPALSHAHTAIA